MRYFTFLFLVTCMISGVAFTGGCGGGSSYSAPTFEGDSTPVTVTSGMNEVAARMFFNLPNGIGMNGELPSPKWSSAIVEPLSYGCTGDSGDGNIGGTFYIEECNEKIGLDLQEWTYIESYSSYVNTFNVTMLPYTVYREGSMTGEGSYESTSGGYTGQYSVSISGFAYSTFGHAFQEQNWLMDGIMSRNIDANGVTVTTVDAIDFAYNDYQEEEYWWIKQYEETEQYSGGNYNLSLSGSYCEEGCLSFETLTDLYFIGARTSWPESGVVVFTGAGGSAAKFTFTGGGAGNKEYDENGDGTYEIGPIPFT